jgi:hypothetical protein
MPPPSTERYDAACEKNASARVSALILVRQPPQYSPVDRPTVVLPAAMTLTNLPGFSRSLAASSRDDLGRYHRYLPLILLNVSITPAYFPTVVENATLAR